MEDADVIHISRFFQKAAADHYFQTLLKETSWQQDHIKIFGKTYPQPRLTALYGEAGKPYSYSNITMHPLPFTKTLEDIKKRAETVSAKQFTSVLLNLYRDGKDSNGWHSDDEKELGIDPMIASVSFGEARSFHFRHKKGKRPKQKLLLEHGSLLLMKGTTQHHWQHQIPKTARKVGPRINLTFRTIKG